jgi:hypothetical protein
MRQWRRRCSGGAHHILTETNMTPRSFAPLAVALLLSVACASTKPAAPAAAKIDPVTDPTVVGALEEGVVQGTAEAQAAVDGSRRIGRVAGVLAAVFGAQNESIDDSVARYRRTRDAVAAASAVIGATHGATEGAKHGFEMDTQFAELHQIEGVEVLRPYPDQIKVHLAAAPSQQTLAAVAAVFANREERAILIQSAGDQAIAVRDSLVSLGVPTASFTVQRNAEVDGVMLEVRYAMR